MKPKGTDRGLFRPSLFRMKAGGGKAAFRQPILFTYRENEREKYDSIALKKFPYIDKWLIYSKAPIQNLPFFHTFLLKANILEILRNDSIKKHLQEGTAILHINFGNKDSVRGDRISIDNGILRIDVYRHRFFQLPICRANWRKLIKYQPHKKSGDYPRVYIEIPLSPQSFSGSEKGEQVGDRIKVIGDGELDYIFGRALQFERNEWILKLQTKDFDFKYLGEPLTEKIHQKMVNFPHFKITLDEENTIFDFLNFPFLPSNDGEEVYLYEVEGNLQISPLLTNRDILLIMGRSGENGVVSFVDEQHPLNPLLHEAATIFMIRPSCIDSPEPFCYTLCHA